MLKDNLFFEIENNLCFRYNINSYDIGVVIQSLDDGSKKVIIKEQIIILYLNNNRSFWSPYKFKVGDRIKHIFSTPVWTVRACDSYYEGTLFYDLQDGNLGLTIDANEAHKCYKLVR